MDSSCLLKDTLIVFIWMCKSINFHLPHNDFPYYSLSKHTNTADYHILCNGTPASIFFYVLFSFHSRMEKFPQIIVKTESCGVIMCTMASSLPKAESLQMWVYYLWLKLLLTVNWNVKFHSFSYLVVLLIRNDILLY